MLKAASLVLLPVLAIGIACSANNQSSPLPGNSGGNGSGGRTGGGGRPTGSGGSISGPHIVPATCGDGQMNSGEECDDANKNGGDGCTAGCRIEADSRCDIAGQPCVSTAVCGNGLLNTTEGCDDLNTNPGDGCAADCSGVEPGWQCRLAGKPCVPFCGDAQQIGTELCDDGNATSGDGCSSTCVVEPGSSCTPAMAGMPSVCTQAVCGNGVKETGEGCDLGEANGLFYGDATGCSKTCTQEPNCRPSGTTQACSTACGDGNVDTIDGEQCDDGNAIAGDGCSDTCQLEGGFTCADVEAPDTVPCPSNAALQCLVLPVTYRDFNSQKEANGHPDFFFMGATTAAGTPGNVGTKTACVPNASGTKAPWAAGDACPSTDAVGACSGIAAPALNAMGKPALAKDTCPCVFTDWDGTGVLTGVAGATECWAEGDGRQIPRIDTMVKVVKDAASFAQWYTASATSTESRGLLELADTGAGTYQFSSSIPGAIAGTVGRTVNDDIHDNCLGATTPLQSGFFPLDTAMGTGSTPNCNLWPYWKAGLTTANCTAGAGNPIVSQWDALAAWDACPTTGTGGHVPRSDGTGTALAGVAHNFYFTTEARYLFRYTAPSALAFYGDDDVWVFVNGKLALDLGAPHERLEGAVTIDGAAFGLEVGRIYEIAVFHADRHPRESNYQLTLSGFSTLKTQCMPRCGDAVTTAGEECDFGDGMNLPADQAYNGCTTECKWGPFCGDNTVNGMEECDLGNMNTARYGSQGCAADCTLPSFCGDGVVDVIEGVASESCDDGPANGQPGSQCENCSLIVL
jgi:fibro-slime domain-containing protein